MHKKSGQLEKIIIKFEPSSAFEEDFLSFLEEVLKWPREEKSAKSKKDENS